MWEDRVGIHVSNPQTKLAHSNYGEAIENY